MHILSDNKPQFHPFSSEGSESRVRRSPSIGSDPKVSARSNIPQGRPVSTSSVQDRFQKSIKGEKKMHDFSKKNLLNQELEKHITL